MKLEFDHETMVELERKRLTLYKLLLDGHRLLESICWRGDIDQALRDEIYKHLKRFESEV